MENGLPTITNPTTLVDPLFERFWSNYPRKIAKRAALLVWIKMAENERNRAIEVLPAHVRYWELTHTGPQYVPHARTWLNQGRWDDELDLPAVEKPKLSSVQAAWWTSESATLAKGRELGLEPRPAEDWNQFRGRIRTKAQGEVA